MGEREASLCGGGAPKWIPCLVALLLLACTFVAYRPVLDNEFVNYDDNNLIFNAPEVRVGLRWDGVVWAFTSVEYSNWFPLTRLSWMLDAELFGLDPAGFHATSLLLHAASTLLLFLAFLRLTRERWPSAFVAAVFALHPLHVESVAWASARKDVLSGLCFMLALLAHERRARGDRPLLWSGLLFAALALGLMAKPILVTLPFVLLLLDVWPLERWRPGEPLGALLALVREKLALFALVAVSSVVTFAAQSRGGAVSSFEQVPMALRVLNAALSYLDYILRAVWPDGLAVLYPISGTVDPYRTPLAVLVLVGASALVLRLAHTRPWYLVGWFWFVGMLMPVLGLVQVGIQASADRYTYLPLIGLTVMLAFGVRDVLGLLAPAARRAAGLGALVLALLVCLACTAATRRQVATWRDTLTLFQHAVAVTRDNAYMLWALGFEYREREELEPAIEVLRRAIEIDPREIRAHRTLADCLVDRGRWSEALEPLQRVAALAPEDAVAHARLAHALQRVGRFDEARRHAERAARLNPPEGSRRQGPERVRRETERRGGAR